jgi:putative protease
MVDRGSGATRSFRLGHNGGDERLPVPEKLIGTVVHYYGGIGVAGVVLSGKLKVGDTIHVKGHTTDFTSTVESMEVDHTMVKKAKKGDDVGIKVSDRAREHDEVYRVR